MVVKVIVAIIALITGGWMVFDGVHVLLKGKYFGPEKPGPWSDLVSAVGIDPFKLGLPFIALGILWLLFLVAMLLHQSWAWYGALLIAILTLWYLPVGTVLSVLYIVLLLVFRAKLQS
jgi:hypothetical protein